MERPAPDSQTVGYAADRERTVAQSHIRMGAGDEERTICRPGCPCGDDCSGSGGSGRRRTQPWGDPQSRESVRRLMGKLGKLGKSESLKVCYEGGPTGY